MDTQDPQVTGLLTIAAQLREAAGQAGRADVVAKVDDVILLIAEGDGGADQRPGGRASDTVLRILNGLGF